jgi:hypothetical protein
MVELSVLESESEFSMTSMLGRLAVAGGATLTALAVTPAMVRADTSHEIIASKLDARGLTLRLRLTATENSSAVYKDTYLTVGSDGFNVYEITSEADAR